MTARSIVAGALLLASVNAFAAQVCDLTLTACPKQLPAGPLLVPMDVISLDARIPYCQEMGTIVAGQPASIFFVIDNSQSMSGTDPDEARFSVVTSLLDSIHAVSPSTRVGMAIFTNRLSFDSRDNALFRPAFPGDTTQHDAYVPLIRLDSLFGGSSPRGVDTLKALLRHNNGALVHNTTQPRERTSAGGGGGGGGTGGTDITLGFEAALEAMKSSPSPKEAQFIIFLSDGLPNNVDASRQDRIYAFEQGTNTPTTFTVYFNSQGDGTVVPERIQTMTTNIRANGYSASNPRSSASAIDLPGAQLQILLQTSVLSQILTVPTTGKSVSVVLNGGPPQSTATRPDSAHFAFAKRMALGAGATAIEFQYTHSFQDTTVRPPVPRDTVVRYTLNVQRSPQAGPLPGTVVKSCRDQADLSLYSGGQSLSAVSANHATLEARLTPIAGQTCAGCGVQVSLTGSADRENLILGPAGAAYSVPFVRLESVAPVPGDGLLQHLGGDSIVLIWTNPENSLDVVRRSYPYLPIPPSLALFSGGRQLDTVTSAHERLEIRLTLPGGEPCKGCIVTATLTGSADREPVAMAGTSSPYLGNLVRGLGAPAPGNGKLEHMAGDSLVFTYENPLNPAQRVRRSYPFVNFADIAGIQPQNTVARAANPPASDAGQWILSDAPTLAVRVQPGSGACCRVLAAPANLHSPDSVRTVGIVVEASREFNLEVKVYSTLGQFVNRLAFTVPREEFPKLSPVNGKESRFLRLLWNGQALSGSPVGTGAYILKTAITLLPIPGVTETTPTATKLHRVGILR